MPRRRPLLLLAAIPLVPIAVALVLSAQSPGRSTLSAALRPLSTGTGPAQPPPPPPPPSPHHHRSRPSGALIAAVIHKTLMRTSPGGRAIGPQLTHTGFGSPAVLLVRATAHGWLGVVSPLAGNGKLGWIPSSSARLSRLQWRIEVSLSHRQVTVLDGGRVLKHYEVAIGRPTAPTPTGYFAVTDRLVTGDPAGPYGCCILALSALAPHVIQGWSGGNRIAIHSTPETWTIGLPVSHGCLRLTLAEGRWLIDHVPLGTPTIIRS